MATGSPDPGRQDDRWGKLRPEIRKPGDLPARLLTRAGCSGVGQAVAHPNAIPYRARSPMEGRHG